MGSEYVSQSPALENFHSRSSLSWALEENDRKYSVADRGLPKGVVPTPKVNSQLNYPNPNLLFGKIFVESCMKMKKNGPGTRFSSAPVSTNGIHNS